LVALERAKALLLLLPAGCLGCVPGDLWGPLGVCPPVPERCEEEREEQGDMVAPEPGVNPAECSGVSRPMALKILFPFMPTVQKKEQRMKLILFNATVWVSLLKPFGL